MIKWALLLHCTKFVGGWGQQEGVKKAQTRKKLMFAILLLLTFFLDDPVSIDWYWGGGMYILTFCIGYILLTISGYMSVGGCLGALRVGVGDLHR